MFPNVNNKIKKKEKLLFTSKLPENVEFLEIRLFFYTISLEVLFKQVFDVLKSVKIIKKQDINRFSDCTKGRS